jgi:predicted secreted protein
MPFIDFDLSKIKRSGPGFAGDSDIGDRGKNPDELDPRKEANLLGARTDYSNQSGLNKGARGQGNAQLNTRAAIANQSLSCGTDRRSNYSQVQVTETPGGHIIEYNDTPGSERILLRHKSGSGIEMRPDGSILISATDIVYDIKGDMSTVVTGNQNTQVDGAITTNAGGDINNRSGGSYVTASGGTLVETSDGSKYSTIAGSVRSRVTGDTSMVNLGPVSHLSLGGLTESVKGDRVTRIEGSESLYVSNAISQTSAERFMASAPIVSITGPQLEVVGNTGTIGGENVISYSYNSYVGKTLQSETVSTNVVYGDLEGNAATATQAGTSLHQSYPDGDAAPSTYTPSVGDDPEYPVDNTPIDTKSTALPSAAVIAARQKTATNGIREVQVDPGDYIRSSLDKSVAYGYEEGAS